MYRQTLIQLIAPHPAMDVRRRSRLSVGSVSVPHRGLVRQRCGEGWQGYHRVTALHLVAAPAASAHPLRHFLVSCRNHISHNGVELPCQRRRVNPAALSCSCLSPHRRAAFCHRCCQKTSWHPWRVVSRANPLQIQIFRLHCGRGKCLFYACFASGKKSPGEFLFITFLFIYLFLLLFEFKSSQQL